MSNCSQWQVLVTRPSAQAEGFAAQIRALGCSVSRAPVLEIAPVSEPSQQQVIKNRVLDFDCYQKAIFVSQNAVHHGFAWLENFWPQLPQGIDYFAVGSATQKALLQYQLLVEEPGGAMNSEALLALPRLQHVEQERILIFRGAGGRTLLGDTLASRGARVDYCELYLRMLPIDAQADLQKWQQGLNWQNPVVVTLHSGESLDNFYQLAQVVFTADQLSYLWLLVPSERVQRQAKDLGFKRIWLADNAADTSMLQRLQQAISSRSF